MADPISMVAIGGTALGSVTKAVGAIFGGFAQSNAYKYQAAVAQINRQIALQNAVYSREVGEFRAEQSGMKSRAQAGMIKTTQAASGFRMDSGSAKDVQESQAMLASSEQNVIRADASKAAYGHEVEAVNFANQAKGYSMAAKNAKTAGFIDAAGSILGGSSSVADKWLQYGYMYG